jgi:single-strand DNA-binding protein
MAANGKDQTFRAPNGIFLSGNLVKDPELKFTSSGKAALSFRIAVDGAGGADESGFFTCTAWGRLAENLVESLKKGERVLVSGRLRHRQFDLEGGKKSSTIEVAVNDAGPSLLWATAEITKTARAEAAPAEAPVPEPAAAS